MPTGFDASAYNVQQQVGVGENTMTFPRGISVLAVLGCCRQVEACHSSGSTVSISGGGGGGGGIRAALSFEGGVAAIYYGAGWSFNIPSTVVHPASSSDTRKAPLLRGKAVV